MVKITQYRETLIFPFQIEAFIISSQRVLPEKRNLPSALEGKSTSWVQATKDVLEGWK